VIFATAIARLAPSATTTVPVLSSSATRSAYPGGPGSAPLGRV
jgi:hypothetical protein